MRPLSTLTVALWEVPCAECFGQLIGGMLVAVLVQSPALMAAPRRCFSPAMGVVLQAQRANIGMALRQSAQPCSMETCCKPSGTVCCAFVLDPRRPPLCAGGAVVVHQSADGFAANLTRGEVVLSSSQGQKFSLVADGATIQPSTSQPTVAQVTWVSPKELLVMSRKGALQVSMGDEVQTVADGASYRMVIDPVAAAASSRHQDLRLKARSPRARTNSS